MALYFGSTKSGKVNVIKKERFDEGYELGYDEGYETGKQDFGIKATESGTEVTLENVNEHKHDISVNLTSDTITDFTGVNLNVSGKNLATAEQVYAKHKSKTNKTVDGRSCISLLGSGNFEYIIEGGFKENTQYTISFEMATWQRANFPNETHSYTLRVTYTDGKYGWISGAQTWNVWKKRTLVTAAGKTVKSIGQVGYDNVGVYIDKDTFLIYEGAITDPVYEPYFEPFTIEANTNGDVEGLESVASTIYLDTDTENVTINAEYYLDGEKEIEKYKNIILDLGGEI